MKLNIVILDISSTRTHSTITNQYQSSTTIITFKTFFFYFSVGFFWTLFFFFYLIIDRPTEERFHDERTTMDMDLLGLLVLPFSFVRSLSLDIFLFAFLILCMHVHWIGYSQAAAGKVVIFWKKHSTFHLQLPKIIFSLFFTFNTKFCLQIFFVHFFRSFCYSFKRKSV